MQWKHRKIDSKDSWEDDIRKYIENKKEVAMSDVLETGLSLDNRSLWNRAT